MHWVRQNNKLWRLKEKLRREKLDKYKYYLQTVKVMR